MVNKQFLVKINDVDNIWYDSDEKVYRRRTFCPFCHVATGCLCYEDLDLALIDEDDKNDYTCSTKCALVNGDWDELGEAMQEAGLYKDLKICLSQLTDAQLKKEFTEYSLEYVLMELYRQNSNIPFSHLNNPSRDEQLEMLWVVGDIKDILWGLDISYYPEPKDLTEEQAKLVLDILNEDEDWEYPSGDICRT